MPFVANSTLKATMAIVAQTNPQIDVSDDNYRRFRIDEKTKIDHQIESDNGNCRIFEEI